MKDKFTVDFDKLASGLLPKKAYRLEDVKDRIERVAYSDLVRVRFPDNEDCDQLWKIEESENGPVIVALYDDNGGIVTESNEEEVDWAAVPDKKSMHIYYKGEPIVSLSSDDMGIPTKEFGLARKWIPKKLANDEKFQASLLTKVASASRQLIPQRFPELRKIADMAEEIMKRHMPSTDREMFDKEMLGSEEGQHWMKDFETRQDDRDLDEDLGNPEVEEVATKLKDMSPEEVKEALEKAGLV